MLIHKPYMRNLFLTIIIILSNINSSFSLTLNFEKFQSLDFLPTKEVRCLYEDKKGFIWFGTSNGLFRFDGYETKIYKSNLNTPDLLTDNNVSTLVEDQDDNLWIGTNKGLNRLDKRTGCIYKINNPYFEKVNISSIIVTPDNNLYVGTDIGLMHYFWKNDSCVSLSDLKDDYAKIPKVIKGLIVDSEGCLWIGSWIEGIVKYDPKSGKIQGFPKIGTRNSAHIIFEDSNNNIWVGTWEEGLYKLKNDKYGRFECWEHINKDKSGNTIVDNVIYCINEDLNNNRIWVGTRKGLSVISDIESEISISNFLPTGENNALSYNEVNSILKDKHGVMWVGMLGGGINFVKTDRPNFKNDRIRGYKERFFTNSIRSLYKDNSGNLWFGLGSYGLACKNLNTGKELFYDQIDELKKETLNTTIINIESSDDGSKIWFSSYDKGIFEYSPENKKIKKLTAVNNNAMEWFCTYDMLVDSDNKYWICTKYGLWLYYPENKYIYSIGDDKVYNNSFNSVVEDNKGRIWAATNNQGIFCIKNKSLGEKSDYINYCYQNDKINTNNIICLFLDKNNKLWAGSEGGGLLFFDEEKDKFVTINDYINFPADVVASILQDKIGNLWLGTNIGLVKLSLNKANPSKSTSRIYTIYDGLIDNIFNHSSYIAKDGEMFFGTHNGYVSFYPEDIKSSTYASPTEITNFKILGTLWDKLSDDEKSKISELSPEYTDQIFVPYDKNNFVIEFANLSFINSDQNKYSYKLEGFDVNWQDVTTGMHSALYNNLPSGVYKFRLRSSSQNGVWTEMNKTLSVRVEPAPWATWWAYLIYFILTIIAAVVTFKIVRNRISLRNKIRLQEMENAKAEEVNQTKLMFFTNITHELLTPLTIISASVDEMKLIEPKYQKQYQVMLNNVNRLIRLLQQILEFRKADSGNLKLKVSKGDMVSFVRNSVESISPLLKKKDITYTFDCEMERFNAYFDIDKLDKILYNLLSNAAKYNETGNKVEISLESEQSGNIAIIKVKDNGAGFTHEAMNRLFERFYEGDYRKHKTIGTGIGLSLTKNLVELHGGTILVESEPNKGACFIVSIPVSHDAFNPEEIEDINLICDDNAESFVETSVIVKEETDNEEKNNILVIEDNDDLKSLMVSILSVDYNVFTASNGIEALDIISNEEVSIIVSDIMMPEMDGIEFTRKMKSTLETSHIPIILLTAKNSEEDRIEAYNIGADGFIGKPFNINVLQAKIKNLHKSKEFHAKDFKKSIDFKAKEFDYTSIDEAFIQKAIDCMHKHLDDPEFDQSRFIEEMAVTKSTLYRKLKSLTGMNTSAFMRNIRLKAACSILMEKKTIRISELAYAVGFSDPKYFTASFKKEFGVLPKDYVANVSKDKVLEDGINE